MSVDTIQSIRQNYSGSYTVTGTVSRLGVSGSYLVRLHERLSGAVVGVTRSQEDGAYAFTNLSPLYRYYAVGHDDGDSPLNAAISDCVTPEPMDV